MHRIETPSGSAASFAPDGADDFASGESPQYNFPGDDDSSSAGLSPEERLAIELERRVETLEDYSVRVRLYDGTIVVLRDMKGADLKAIEKMGNYGNIEKTMRLLTRLCTKWGNNPGIALAELDTVRARDLTLLGQVLGKFL